MDVLLSNITSNYRFVGYEILKSYGIHDIFKDTADIAGSLESYREHLVSVLSA